jgi:hydroxyethylthiazole kinase-like sugar kinase family protein
LSGGGANNGSGIDARSRMSTNTNKNLRDRMATEMGVTSSLAGAVGIVLADNDNSIPDNGVPMIVTADPLA